MTQWLARALLAFFLLTSFTFGSAVAQVACSSDGDQAAISVHGHRSCPNNAKAHDCANACPQMCGAFVLRRATIAAPPAVAAAQAGALQTFLASLDRRPDIPPPRSEMPSVQFS
jgi:hypothetical protein